MDLAKNARHPKQLIAIARSFDQDLPEGVPGFHWHTGSTYIFFDDKGQWINLNMQTNQAGKAKPKFPQLEDESKKPPNT